MVMFAKVSLESFVYDLTQLCFFPNKKTKENYNKYMIEQIFPYSILTDTDSICVFFFLPGNQKVAPQIHNLEIFCLKFSLTAIFYVDLIPHRNFGRNIQSEMNS